MCRGGIHPKNKNKKKDKPPLWYGVKFPIDYTMVLRYHDTMIRLNISLPDNQYQALRKQSFDTKESMSKIVRLALSCWFVNLQEDIEASKMIKHGSKLNYVKDKQEPKKAKKKEKAIGLCKHNRMLGLCEHGCK